MGMMVERLKQAGTSHSRLFHTSRGKDLMGKCAN